MEKIFIHTDDRNAGSVTKGSIQLDHFVEGEYVLTSLQFTNNIYNIRNFSLSVDYGPGFPVNETISIPDGLYSKAEFRAALATSIAATPLGFVITAITYDAVTGKITFTNTVDILVYSNSTIWKIMGFASPTANLTIIGAGTLTFPYPMDLVPIKSICLLINEDTHQHYYGKGYFKCSAVIQPTFPSPFGELFVYENRTQYKQRIKFGKQTKSVSWHFFDQTGTDIDFNNASVVMTLEAL